MKTYKKQTTDDYIQKHSKVIYIIKEKPLTKPIPVIFLASYLKQKEHSETKSGIIMNQTGKPEDDHPI